MAFDWDTYTETMPHIVDQGDGWIAWTHPMTNGDYFSVLADDGNSIKGADIVARNFADCRDNKLGSFSSDERTKALAAIAALEARHG